jgi:hypothetical protein
MWLAFAIASASAISQKASAASKRSLSSPYSIPQSSSMEEGGPAQSEVYRERYYKQRQLYLNFGVASAQRPVSVSVVFHSAGVCNSPKGERSEQENP